MVVEQLWQPVPGGSGTYVRELANGLHAYGAAHVRGIKARGSSEARRGLDPGIPISRSVLPRAALYEAWRRTRRPRVPGWRDVDVVHATTWAIPPPSAPLVVTVHDLAFLREPEHFTAHGAAYFRQALRITQNEASAVIVPSAATAKDCVDAGIDRDRIQVVQHGIPTASVADGEVAAFRLRNGLDRPYLLWVGTLEPRKNLRALLEAYSLIRSEGTDLDLVLVGPQGWGETGNDVRVAVERLGADRVHRLGLVSREDLQAAYAGARAFCFPSVWEGFGLPVLEAQAHGTPVVTSRGTSMEEICGPSALAVDPHDVASLAEALLLASGPRHDELSSSGRTNSARFTWEAAVAATAHVYQNVSP